MDALTLSKYDDLLSDVLLDQVGLWFETRKMFPRYRQARTNKESVVDLVRRVALGVTGLPAAVEELLDQEYLAAFLRHKSEVRLADFRLHAGRYFSMYLPEAGYEIALTDRYKVVTKQSEARVVATKRYTLGMVISLCSGSVAKLSESEIQRMERESADFSVMWWSKKKSMCLFLGPARFVNHDCDSNCRFTALGSDAICFQALRTIEPGEEITTHYGSSYFGEGNCECLCATCEKYSRGWYARHRIMEDGSVVSIDFEPELETSAMTVPVLSSESVRSVSFDADSDSLSVPAVALGGVFARVLTRNKGRRSVTPAGCFPFRGYSSGLPRCPLCPADVASTSLCPRCCRHQMIYGLPWPERKLPVSRASKSSGSSRKRRANGGGGSEQSSEAGDSQSDKAKRLRQLGSTKKRPVTIYDGRQGSIDASPAEMFALRAVGTPVLIDPLDTSVERWWPAVIVEHVLEPTEDGRLETQYQVRYFEDGSYSVCQAHEMVLLDPSQSPLSKWLLDEAMQRDMLGEVAVRRALAYFDWRFIAVYGRQLAAKQDTQQSDLLNDSVPSDAAATAGVAVVGALSTAASSPSSQSPADDDAGVAPSSVAAFEGGDPGLCRLSKFAGINEISRLRLVYQTPAIEVAPTAENDPEVVFDHFFELEARGPSSAGESKSSECIQPYLHQVRDLVDIIDGRDGKVYHARIREVEFVNNGKRFGLYYFVHYQGWNPKFDEWVPPSRIIYTI
ncbi:histone lysine methyltransferase Set9 [Coemansia spiralis]|uniref:Histone lysine methyltransferase Set9 n=1 Tax=Coemansia spiralis TaxID=417178 RepID=A0A9W8L530_9FUNG|nr:histone lysine methyltransferase Set9 [Coemansia spiralis]